MPEDQNGWVQWQKVCDSLPEVPGRFAKASYILQLDHPSVPDEEEGSAISDEILMKLEAALRLPVWKCEEWHTFMKIPATGSTYKLHSWLDVRMLQAIRMGRHADIIRIVDIASRFVRRTTAGSASDYYANDALNRVTWLPLLLAKVDFTETELERLSEITSADPYTAEDRAEVMRQAHRMLRTMILELEPSSYTGSANPVRAKYLFKRNATANLAARICRAKVKAALEGRFLPDEWLPESARVYRWSPNQTGRAIALSMRATGGGTFALRRIVEHRCARVVVALHRYWKATGALPDDLSALVPRFLPEVPADPYDARSPLRWDKAKRVVFSIGKHSFGNHEPAAVPEFVGLVDSRGLGVRFRRPEEGPDAPVK